MDEIDKSKVNSNNARLLNLPPEIRKLIYEHLFVTDIKVLIQDTSVPKRRHVAVEGNLKTEDEYPCVIHTAVLLAPLLACRLVYGEASSLAYRRTPGVISISRQETHISWAFAFARRIAAAPPAAQVRSLVLTHASFLAFRKTLKVEFIRTAAFPQVELVTFESLAVKMSDFAVAMWELAVILPRVKAVVMWVDEEAVTKADRGGIDMASVREWLDTVIASQIMMMTIMKARERWVTELTVMTEGIEDMHHSKFDRKTETPTCLELTRLSRSGRNKTIDKCGPKTVSSVGLYLGTIEEARAYLGQFLRK